MLLKLDDTTRAAVHALAARLDELEDGVLVHVDSAAGELRAIVLGTAATVEVQEVAQAERWKVPPLNVKDRPTGPPAPPIPTAEVRQIRRSAVVKGTNPAPEQTRQRRTWSRPESPVTGDRDEVGSGGPPDEAP